MKYWEVLGLAPTEDIKEIKRAYARHLKTLDLSKDAAAFQVLREAYDQALAAAKGVKQDVAPTTAPPLVMKPVAGPGTLEPQDPDINLEAEIRTRNFQTAMDAGLAELFKRLMLDYGEKAWSVYIRRRSEMGELGFDGCLQWDHRVFMCLVHWSGSPFPGAFAERFAQHAEIFQDIKYQKAYPYAFFLYYGKLKSYRSLLEKIRRDSKDAAWTYILAARSEASHEKAARNLVTWAAMRRLLVTLEDESPELLHTMFHQDTLAFWQNKTRGLPPIWTPRGFLWGLWGVMFLPVILTTSLGWDLRKDDAGLNLLGTFVFGYFHRWFFYALANVLRYRRIGRLDDSLAKVLMRPKMRVASLVTAVIAAVGCYLLPLPWAGILPILSLFAFWLALGPTYFQMAIPNGIVAMLVIVDLIQRMPENNVFLATFVPVTYVALGVLYVVRLGYARVVDRVPSWISPTVRGLILFFVSGLIVRFGLQLILRLTGS
ncbi:MAG TPA: hypothetical protein VFO10_23715 [Oligoflexus sp.]|uniref:J domain-containing protein n=1 Tax=Oligoflexus sp. TaxID=1971216 RepID=UPI002D7ECB23|nr:hypothetical protein [Oligoflexus sp.]HET9240291.1 hypothetical protein [Oligoflexus sp.]